MAYCDMGSVNVLDTAFGCRKHNSANHNGAMSSMAYTSCGSLLVSGGYDNKG